MELQIIQYNRLIHNEAYQKAEHDHNGMKYGEYYRLLKRTQHTLMTISLARTSLIDKLKRQRFSKSGKFTTETN